VEHGRIPDRYVGIYKNFLTGECFRVISFKIVIRFEYFYKNRCISTKYVGIKYLFDNFKVLKNLERCDRDGGTWNNSRTVRRDLRKISRPESFFELFPLKALEGANIFTEIVISLQNTSGLSIYLIILKF
jgi:hypothetical protein